MKASTKSLISLKASIQIFILFVIVILFFSSCREKERSILEANTIAFKIDSLLTIAQQNNQFNGVLLFADTTGVTLNRAYGNIAINQQALLNEHSKFEIASVSKTITATLIMRMVELNYFSLESKLIEFFPELPYNNITIKHLLQHTSGIPDYYDHIVSKYWDRSRPLTNDALFALFEKYTPKTDFAPGEKFEYSNTGYYFLAGISEKASQETYDELLKKYIFEPAGMEHSKRSVFAEGESGFAKGHELSIANSKYVTLNNHEYPEDLLMTYFMDRKGPGGISSTTNDLWKFSQAIKFNKILKEKTTEQMFTPGVLNDGTKTSYGLGWQLAFGKNNSLYTYHRGGTSGYRSYFMIAHDKGYTYALLTNSQNPYFTPVNNAIQKIITNQKVEPIKHSGVEYLSLIYKNTAYQDLEHKVDSLRNLKNYYFNLTEFNSLAWKYWLKKDFENGTSIMKLAVVSMPDNAGVLEVLAECYAETGQNKIAVDHYTKVIEMLNADIEKRDKKWVKDWIVEIKTKIDSLM